MWKWVFWIIGVIFTITALAALLQGADDAQIVADGAMAVGCFAISEIYKDRERKG